MLEKILKDHGIDKVSARTKISRKHLTKLREKNFEGFSKPQAYGFVSILQREYGDDFEELKKELDAWFCEGEECKEEIFVAKPEQSGPQLKKIVGAAVTILILMAAAMFFVQKESGMTGPAPVESLEAKSAVQKSGGNLQIESAEGIKKSSDDTPNSASDNVSRQSGSAEAAMSDAKLAAESNATASGGEPEPYVPMENAVITPVVKLWFGVIDLKTKKRIAKTTADPYEIESKGRWLLITGHGRFEISDAFGNLFKYNDAQKHYFLIDDGMVKEIPVAEFRRLNGGRVW